MKVIKVFHLIFLFLWLGSLFILPHLIREKFSGCFRFYKKYELPCMIFAVISGILLLLLNPEKLKMGGFHMKLTCVFILIGIDLWTARQAYLFQKTGHIQSKALLRGVQLLIFFFIACIFLALIAWQK